MNRDEIPDIRKIDSEIKLYTVEQAHKILSSGYEGIRSKNLEKYNKIALDYLIEQNQNGILPTIKDLNKPSLMRGISNNENSRAMYNLTTVKKYSVLTGKYSIAQIIDVYGDHDRGFRNIEIPKSLESIRKYFEYLQVGTRGSIISWKNKDLKNFPKVVVAKIVKDGKPVFSKIFSLPNYKKYLYETE